LTVCRQRYTIIDMTIKDCAADCGRSEKTIRRWIKTKGLSFRREGFRGTIIIDPVDWENFCITNYIRRKNANI